LALIEFLLKHWYIAVILLALFSQFTKRSSRRGNSEGNGKGSMPTFGGNPRVPGQMSPRPVNRPETLERADTRVSSHSAGQENKTSGSGFNPPQTASRGSLLDNEASNEQGEAMIYQDAYVDSSANTALQTSKQQLAQGIIWAEILGPPRAKKPFRR
jgi:hypothetical protein